MLEIVILLDLNNLLVGYHKHIEDWFYYILMENGDIKKRRGWRVEKVEFLND